MGGGGESRDGMRMESARLIRAALLIVLVLLAALPSETVYTVTAQVTRTPAVRHRRHRGQAPRHRRRRHSSSAGRPVGASAPAPRLLWSDEFNGPAGAPPNPAKWEVLRGGNGWGNRELEYYTGRPSNVALDGAGHLAITARHEVYRGGDGVIRSYTSARLQTEGLFQTTYGKIEARIKVPAARGLWPAFWALGYDIDSVGWPASGEIDVMENIGSDPFTIYGSIHGPQPGSMRGYALTAIARSRASLAAGYHIYGVTWSPNRIVFTLDGVPYATRTRAGLSAGREWVFNKPFFLLLDMAVGGTWPGRPSATSRLPATMLIDWVRVYAS